MVGCCAPGEADRRPRRVSAWLVWRAAIFYICEEIDKARALEGAARGRSIGGAFRPPRGSWGAPRFFTFVRKLARCVQWKERREGGRLGVVTGLDVARVGSCDFLHL